MSATWTDPVDRADGYVVGETVWNQLLGDTGNQQYLYERTVYKYASATQALSATTTFADVVAAGSPATMSVTVGASEVWHIRAHIRVLYAGTGGLKLQFTGPAAPTSVKINGTKNPLENSGTDSNVALYFAEVTAFSSSFAAHNAAAATVNTYSTTDNGGAIDIDLFLINGANAGTVTLQAAQNSANSTSTIQIGSWIRGDRVA